MCEQVASTHHLLLDTAALSIANAKMKTQKYFIGFFIIGLLSQCGLGERGHGQAYLPPAVQNAITEEIITIEEHSPGHEAHFDESRYGGGKYQVYEVHHHYEPPSQNLINAPGYLPPEQTQPHKSNVRHLDIPSPSFVDTVGGHGQDVVQSEIPLPNRAPNEKVINVENFHISQLQNGNGQPSAFRGADYLPPHHGSEAVSHQQSNPTHNYSPSHDQHSTSFIRQDQHTAAEQSNFRAPDYLPPHETNYQAPRQSEHYPHHHETQQQVSQSPEYKGPDYLPPHHTSSDHSQHNTQESGQLKGPAYLPPHQTNSLEVHQQTQHHSHQGVQQAGQYKGPDYLPPHQTNSLEVHQQQTQHYSHQDVRQAGQYKGPDYLPPHQTNSLGVQQQSQHHSHQDDQQAGQYKGPDYLPPHQTNPHQGVQQGGQYKGPDYLPPYQTNSLGGQQQSQHHSHQDDQQAGQYKGPDYLPPITTNLHKNQHQAQHHIQQQHEHNHIGGQQQLTQADQFKGPDYLPPHHGQSDQSQYQTQQNTRQPGTLPPGYEVSPPASQPQFQYPIQQPIQQAQKPQSLLGAAELPPGYDFEKPDNAEEAIAELHTLPEEDHGEFVVQSQIQAGQNEQQSHIYSGQQQSAINFQANGYLPPHQTPHQTNANYQVPQTNLQTTFNRQQNAQQYQNNVQQTSPQIFTPTPAPTAPQAPVQTYLPHATPVQAEQYSSNLHSLSSFMSNVQPNVRYGVAQFTAPHQPFREYGPPPANVAIGSSTSTQHHQQQQYRLPVVSPMYRDQASRSPYYAPTMSYATNSLANSYTTTKTTHQQTHQQHYASFNHQTRQNLQQFMPQDIRQSNHNHFSNSPPARAVPAAGPSHSPASPAVPVRQSPSSRVRTVQILNLSSTKTIKVLETLDHAGVKTIKILGPSNQQPTGEHHIIKVVSQSANSPHEQIQTVKIFNDHHDHAASSSGRNGYLPPVTRVLRQSLSNRKQRRPFTGRRRYSH